MLRNFLPAVCLLFFLLVLLMSCVNCGAALVETPASQLPSNTFVLFNSDTEFENCQEPGKKYKSFTSPSFGYFENMLVVFAQAKESGEAKCEIVEGFFKFENNGDLKDRFVEKPSANTWKERIATPTQEKHCSGSPTAVFNKTNIYVFFNSSNTGGSEIKYNVIASQKIAADVNNGITWEASEDLTEKLEDLKGTNFVSSGGSGIAINNSLIVPVWYKKDEDTFFSIIISARKDEDQQWSLTLIKSFKEGKYPAIVEWGGKLIMMISCSEGIRKVYEYSDTQTTWPEAVGSISGVWGNAKERAEKEYGGQWGFIAANIQIEQESEKTKKKVILVTQPVAQPATEPVGTAVINYKLHLWMTDYQRVFDAGPISAGLEQNTSSTLLFEKDNLFAAYEVWKEGEATINVVHLKDQLATIKKVLDTWSKHDKELLQFCFAADGTITSGGKCSDDNKIPTNGLVGFLSDNDDNTTRWKDKYLCVHATAAIDQTKIKKVNNGLQFNGAGAVWPVSQQGQNQQYYFVNHAFTLVAAVTIDGDTTNENTNSILGFNFGKKGSKKTFGLWCTKNGEWEIGENTKKATEKNCDKNKTYQVVLTLNEKRVLVYIDGKIVKGLSQDSIATEQPLNITYFYFGAETNEKIPQPATESRVTVRNVLLYNKHFTDKEIEKLLPKKEIVEKNVQQTNEPKNTKPQTPKESTTETDSSFQDTSNNESEKEEVAQSSSPPPTTEDSAARAGVVGVLCFMLFDVFTLLGRYVY